jgi:hypothetical protein
MLSHTTKLAGRKTRDLQLTQEEARAMWDKGSRFAEFEPEQGRCRVSMPYEVIVIADRDELIIRQE